MSLHEEPAYLNVYGKLYTTIMYCKVAGSNLTCRDDSKTRWRLHSVDPTSTGLFSLSQNIIHSSITRVVWMMSACIEAYNNARID